ncbi:MAG: tripartite tricarboxylate transporter TctB family protein [Pseudomonadota bacterium]|nr:tripartite tricarboxylate transporter TctB family protein [Pseudomonadota bacterium]
MRIANLISGAVLVLFGLVMLALAIPAQIEEGPAGMMSPRLVPQMMVWLILGLSLLLIVTNLRASSGEAGPFTRDEVIAFVRIGGVFVFSLVLFFALGVLAASLALILGALLVLGERRPLVLVLMPLGLIGAAYVLFTHVLGTVFL